MSKAFTVAVHLGDKQIGEVAVVADDDTEPIQAAATAMVALSEDAEYVVDGQTFNAKDLIEWFA